MDQLLRRQKQTLKERKKKETQLKALHQTLHVKLYPHTFSFPMEAMFEIPGFKKNLSKIQNIQYRVSKIINKCAPYE